MNGGDRRAVLERQGVPFTWWRPHRPSWWRQAARHQVGTRHNRAFAPMRGRLTGVRAWQW
jgi:hypothetical protein